MVAGFLSTSKEIREGDTNFPPRVMAPDEHCSTEKAGDTGREGNAVFTLEAIAIRCSASLRTIDNHLGLRGVIQLSPSHTLTALSMTSSLPTCRVVFSHRWSSRDSWVGGALPYLRAAPNCCSAGLVRLTCRPPE